MTTTNYHNRQPVSSLLPAIREFFPPEILPFLHFYSGGRPTNYQNTKAAIYGGSDQELLEKVRNFANFIGSYDRLGMESHPYNLEPVTLKSVRGPTEWHYLRDVFSLIASRVPKYKKVNLKFDPNWEIVAEFLRIREAKLNGSCKLIPDVLAKMERLFEQFRLFLGPNMKHHFASLNVLPDMCKLSESERNVDGVFRKLRESIPECSINNEGSPIFKVLQKLNEMKPIHRNPDLYQDIVLQAIILTSFIDIWITGEPEWFLPMKPEKKDRKIPENIRLFYSGKKSYFLVDDLAKLMKDKGCEECNIRKTFEQVHDLVLIDGMRLMDSSLFNNVELVVIPLKSARHRAQYIPYSNGKHCILDSELLFELLRYAISVKSLFQKMSEELFKRFNMFFKCLDDLFHPLREHPRFIDVREAEAIRKQFSIFLEENFEELMEDTKPILPIGSGGFTVKDLTKEINRLGISKILPYSNQVCNSVYEHVSEVKQGRVLRTCDMYYALESYQLICLLKKIEIEAVADTGKITGNFYTWIVNKGRCSEPPICCVFCSH